MNLLPKSRPWHGGLAALLLATAGAAQVESTAHAPYVNFESGPTRQLMVTPSGEHLLLLNTIDHRLEIYRIDAVPGGGGTEPQLTLESSLFTGLEPVSMALDPTDPERLFVVNMVSDSVSVVDLEDRVVVDAITVGDEPRDIEIVGGKIFVATSRSRAIQPQSQWVEHAVVILDGAAPYAKQKVIDLKAHKPRSLTTDGTYVYAVPQNSGNNTTLIQDDTMVLMGRRQRTLDAFDTNIIVNEALTNTDAGGPMERGWRIPPVGRIVFDWEYPFLVQQLRDRDVRAIRVANSTLARNFTQEVGTTLFAIERNPVTGELWVANTDANNRIRMEYNQTGKAVENRITVVASGPGGDVQDTLVMAPPFTSRNHGQLTSIAFHSGAAGDYAYVTSLGTSTVLVLDPTSRALIAELDTEEMPGGIAVDPVHEWLFVYGRGGKTLQAFDIAAGHAPVGSTMASGYDPEPPVTAQGRRVLYSADDTHGAGNGVMACASCHVFGDTDQLAWDLGNSQGAIGYFYPDTAGFVGTGFSGKVLVADDMPQQNPMKGPLFTQTLRGMKGGAPFHWRGDRRFLHNFQPAFVGLNGGTGVSDANMQSFVTFLDGVHFPPNPYQDKSREYQGDQLDAIEVFGMPPFAGKNYVTGGAGFSCNDCHSADLLNLTDIDGADENIHEESIFQMFNTATLRGVYEKKYLELTGFGTHHDGGMDGTFGFLDARFFGLGSFDLLTNLEKNQLHDLVDAWDAGIAPLIGEQIVLDPGANRFTRRAIDLARLQAEPGKDWLDIVGHGWILNGGVQENVGMVYALNPVSGAWEFHLDDDTWMDVQSLAIEARQGRANIVLTCVPFGTGERLGIDRDEDGLLDRIETLVHGTLPNDPDTDDDGYDDATELLLGGNPLVADVTLADTVAPAFEREEITQVFVSSASLTAQTDEPTTLSVSIVSAGGATHGPFVSGSLRRTHELVFTGLPAGLNQTYTMTATDRNGNTAQVIGSFETVEMHAHVQSIELNKLSTSPVVLEAKFTVVDRAGNLVPGMPLRGRFAGDIGGQPLTFEITTNAQGVATFQLPGYNPSGASMVTVGLDYLGTDDPNHTYFVGRGGQSANFFYEASANAQNYATVDVP